MTLKDDAEEYATVTSTINNVINELHDMVVDPLTIAGVLLASSIRMYKEYLHYSDLIALSKAIEIDLRSPNDNSMDEPTLH